MKDGTLYVLDTPEHLDAIKEPRIACTTDRKVRKVINHPDVKQYIKDQISRGNVVQIESFDNSLFANYYDKSGKPIETELTLGKQVLDEGLDMAEHRVDSDSYRNLVKRPIVYSLIGGAIGAGVKAATASSGNPGALVEIIQEGMRGLGLGAASGVGVDAIDVMYQNACVAKRAAKKVMNRNFIDNVIRLAYESR